MQSFRKTKGTGAGTSLVSLSVRNLKNDKGDSAQLNITTLNDSVSRVCSNLRNDL